MGSSNFESWLAEKQSSILYAALASKEQDKQFSELFRKLGEAALEQAEVWENKMRAAGEPVPRDVPVGLRLRFVIFLINMLGAKPIRTILAASKIRGISVYTDTIPAHPYPESIHDIGRRHTALGFGGNFRAAVFGINDGIVSNAALIFGMVGASSLDPHIVILAGFAGLLAGAFSMAAGEFLSVRSQKELFEYQIGLEAEELKLYPEEEAAELAIIYEARGMQKSDAALLAKNLIANPQTALDTLAREELGLNPNELGSEYQVAISSFVAFAFGAAIPLVPFFFLSGASSFVTSIIATAVALFTIGAVLSLFTGRSAIMSAFRMLGIGAGAATLTYFIGHVLGVSIS